MIVFNLACEQAHRFEGWFGSSGDYEAQRVRGLVTCPVCDSSRVEKQLHAPRLNFMGRSDGREENRSENSHQSASSEDDTKSLGAEKSDEASSASTQIAERAAASMPDHLRAEIREEVRAQIKEMVTHVMQNTEDVGRGFAEEARKMHYNEAPARGIRGVASREEAEELAEEGIPVASLPFAVFDKSELN